VLETLARAKRALGLDFEPTAVAWPPKRERDSFSGISVANWPNLSAFSPLSPPDSRRSFFSIPP
jgi:hypothetical protein